MAERVRAFAVRGKERDAVSIGGTEHLTLPASYPSLLEVNVYLGWFGALAKPLQAGSLAGSVAMRVPGVRPALKAAADRLVGLASAPRPRVGHLVGRGGGLRRRGREALRGRADAAASPTSSRPASSPGLRSGPPRRAWTALVRLGPVQAFGLEALEAGCREAGLAARRGALTNVNCAG